MRCSKLRIMEGVFGFKIEEIFRFVGKLLVFSGEREFGVFRKKG